MAPKTVSRWRAALAQTARIERREHLLPSAPCPTRWYLHGRSAVRGEQAHGSLPAVLEPKQDPTATIRSRAAAVVVKLGKFDVERDVRLRAFYVPEGLSVRLQGGGPKSGIERILQAWSQVRIHAPSLMPRIVADGHLRTARYLLEEAIFGRHPVGGRALQRLAYDVAAGLHRVHQGVGVSELRLSSILSAQFEARWRAVVQVEHIDPATDEAVRALVRRDGLLDVSLGHGDLVGTNILELHDRVVLIDWEYAGSLPVAFDLAKMHLRCAEPDDAMAAVQAGLGGSVGTRRGHYSFPEQLALAHALYISRSGSARTRAAAAGRTAQLEQNVAVRVSAIQRLLHLS